jgi:predicted transposase YbfD/YdcC
MNDIFIECFGELKDKRYKNKQYNLLEVIAIVLCGVMSGMENFFDIEVFAKSHQDWFVEHLLLTSGIPSSDTMRRVISMLEPKQFADSFLLWVRRVKELLQEQVVAIDGKTLRGSKIQNKGKKAIHLVNAYSCANGLTLKQIKVDDKSNEIKAIPEIINSLSLKGTIVTIDAMGCQKSITEHIIKVEADYILAVKGNHKSLQEPIQDIFTLGHCCESRANIFFYLNCKKYLYS